MENLKSMKKQSVFLFCGLCLVFWGCNSKESSSVQENSELKNQINLLSEENSELKNQNNLFKKENNQLKAELNDLKDTISKLEKENDDLTERLNDTAVNLEDKSKYEVHDLAYSLVFSYDGYDTKVYKTPNVGKSIYTIQKGDTADVSKFIHVKQQNKNFVKVKIGNNLEGYIQINGNPYQNGNFEVAEILSVDEIKTTILKMEQSFTICEGTNIKELPSENSKNVHEITHSEGDTHYKSLFITSDYKWVKMQVGEFTGWVPSKALGVGRGGPVLNTPEQFIQFDLIDGNEI